MDNDDKCDVLETISVRKIKLMDDDAANNSSKVKLAIDVPVKDLLPLVSNSHYEAMEVLSQREFSSSGVTPTRQPRFRFLIFKGKKQFAYYIYPRYDRFSALNLYGFLVEKFYLKLFADEKDELTKMINDDDMWHILLIGYRLPTEKDEREHVTLLEKRKKENNKRKKKSNNKKRSTKKKTHGTSRRDHLPGILLRHVHSSY
jgi:hypothetical protein